VKHALDQVPVFVCANQAGDLLKKEQPDGERQVIFFADIETAKTELARASDKYPEQQLSLMAVGLGDAYTKAAQGTAVLLPSKDEVAVAKTPDGKWANNVLPLFGCPHMRTPREDGSDAMPLFVSSSDARQALGQAEGSLPDHARDDADLGIVCVSLEEAVEMSASPAEEVPTVAFVPPSASIAFLRVRHMFRIS